MYSGWFKLFPINRPLRPDEARAVLSRQRDMGGPPHNWSTLIHFNSTYAEFIDRRYRLRGMVATTAGVVGCVLVFAISAFFVPISMMEYLQGKVNPIFAAIVVPGLTAITCVFIWASWHYQLRHDMFTYTHYPIRFNRKTRQVYVFRHNGPGGVLTVPFDEVFWHVGNGLQHTFLRDVRGHVMDGNMVRDTFAVGNYFSDDKVARIISLWEFIRRYMDEGPEAVAEHPLDRVIDLSVTPSWTNCYLWVIGSLGAGFYALRFVLFFLYYPIVGLLTVVRRLTLRSCKWPQWPAEVEAACRVEPDDPHRWEEPTYMSEFANRPGAIERDFERLREFERLQGRF